MINKDTQKIKRIEITLIMLCLNASLGQRKELENESRSLRSVKRIMKDMYILK